MPKITCRRVLKGWVISFLVFSVGLGIAPLYAAFQDHEEKESKEDLQKRDGWFSHPRSQGLKGRNPAELLFQGRQQSKGITKSHFSLSHLLGGPKGGPTSGNWVSAGPQPVTFGSAGVCSGRGSAIALDLVNDPTGNTVYYGAASGGVWKSTNALGASPLFTSLNDQADSLAVGAVALDSSTNPPTLFEGTGEANGAINSTYYGVGILKSTDGGNTWAAPVTAASGPGGTGTVSFFGQAFSRILVDPNNHLDLVAGTTPGSFSSANLKAGSLQPLSLSTGVFYSTDGGNTWTQSADLAGQTVTDIVFDSTRNTYYAAVYGQGIYSSTNQGQNWTVTTSPFLADGGVNMALVFNRTSLAARNGTLYALISAGSGLSQDFPRDTGLVQSVDGGNSWTPIAAPPGNSDVLGGQLGYDLCILAPPGTNGLVIGGVVMFSTANVNGLSTTWTAITPPHADQHAIVPVSSSQWFVACDGGLFTTSSSGTGWTSLNGTLSTIQFYSVSPDSNAPGVLLGGAQDNASELNNGTGLAWNAVFGGDGFYTLADTQKQGVFYGESTFGDVERYDSSSNADTTVLNPLITGVPPIEMVPQAPGTMVAGGTLLLMGPANPASPGAGWVTLGGPFPDGSDIGFLAPAPGNLNTIYLTEGNFIQKTTNATSPNPSFTQINPAGISLPLGHIAVSPSSPSTVYVAVEGFFDGQKIYMSPDGGTTWMNISGTLPNVPLNWISIDPENPNTLYLATDVGVFTATDGGVVGESWQVVGAGLPNAPILQVKIAEVSRQLVASIFGRGAWTLNIGGTPAPTFTATATPTFPCGVPNAANWVSVTTNAAFAPRDNFGSAVFNGDMWVIGGRTGVGTAGADNRDVWSSPDGVNWTLANPAAFSNPREEFSVLTFDPGDGLGPRMWLFGGFSPFTNPANTIYNDIWSSDSAGDSWNQVTANAPFPARLAPACAVFNNRMWVLGGGGFDDVWSSADGVNWTQNVAHVPGFLAIVTNAAVLNGQLWAISQSDSGANPNQLWSSPDGSTWSQITTNTGFPPRDNFAFLSYAGLLWVIGGTNGVSRFNDVWSSPDGVHWSEVASSAQFSPRGLYQGGLVFQDEMWAIGGALAPTVPGGATQFANDVWHSACGAGGGGVGGIPPGRQFKQIVTLQTGTGGASNSSVTVNLPAFTTLVSSSLTPTSVSGNQLVFNYASLSAGTAQIVLDLAVSPTAPGGSSLVSQVKLSSASILSEVSPPNFQVLGPTATFTPTPSPTQTFTETPSPTATFEFSADCKDGPCQLRCGLKDDDDFDHHFDFGRRHHQDEDDGTVRLEWQEAQRGFFHHPDGYWIFRASSAKGPYVLIQTLTPSGDPDHDLDENTTDQPGPGTWCYVVRAFGGSPVTASEATEPCCLVVRGGMAKTSTPSATPTVSPIGTSAPNFSPTPTPTQAWAWWRRFDSQNEPGSSPTAGAWTGGARVSAAPNISRNGNPIQFRIPLSQPARVDLDLYSLSGEEIYETSMEGQTGLNSLVWRVENQSRSPVASGLYFYVIRIGEGSQSMIQTGKVAVIR